MKTFMLITLFLVITSLCFSAVVQIGTGFDILGNHKVKASYQNYSNTFNYDVSIGMSPYLEILAESHSLLYGGGIEYQVHRSVDFSSSTGKMGFTPLYGVIRFKMQMQNLKPELIGQLGYNFFTADDDYQGSADLSGGLYYGFGLGLPFDKLIIQIMYKANSGQIKQI